LIAFLTRKILYGILVMLGVVVIVFFLFQGIGDPARLVVGQTGDEATLKNIRKELYLDQPKHKQFLFYLRDISPVAIHSVREIEEKKLVGIFLGDENKFGIKVPYLRRSYQSKRPVLDILTDALPGTLVLAIAAMFFATIAGSTAPRCSAR
jgi:peptide/nickel transport system permease protein